MNSSPTRGAPFPLPGIYGPSVAGDLQRQNMTQQERNRRISEGLRLAWARKRKEHDMAKLKVKRVPAPKPKKARTDDDYCRLDDAIGAFMDWREEIVDALAARSISWRSFSETVDAARRVHSPGE